MSDTNVMPPDPQDGLNVAVVKDTPPQLVAPTADILHQNVAAQITPQTAELAQPGHRPSNLFIAWVRHDWPYVAMLLLALAGIVLALPVDYWLFLTPVFAAMSIMAGWRNFASSTRHGELVFQMLLSWGALFVAIVLLFQSGTRGLMNSNANAVSMMILLALGTFTAGLQAKVWRISAVGAFLFLAVPAMSVLVQSALLWAVVFAAVVMMGFGAWWVYERNTSVGTPVT